MDESYVGSSFDSFLEEEGINSQCDAIAVKRVLAWQIEQAMKEKNMTKTEMARCMSTSRTAVDRLLDTENTSISLQTMERAARVLGKKIHFQLLPV